MILLVISLVYVGICCIVGGWCIGYIHGIQKGYENG